MSTPSDQDIIKICDLLNQRLGFCYGPQKKYLVCSRLEKRLRELNIPSYREYYRLLENDSAELNKFYDLITTNVTSFFRESDQFEILKTVLLPKILAQHRGDNKIRCWSAGCSSGEEAYTLAIVLNESMGTGWDLRVLATDISIQKLEEGMKGVYPEDRLQGVPGPLAVKYFQKVPGESGLFQVKPELRQKIVFRRINLNEDFQIPSYVKFDLIFCRNVFIYLSNESRTRAVNGFYSYLKDDGFLFMGHSEALSSFSDTRWRSFKDCIYQKLP